MNAILKFWHFDFTIIVFMTILIAAYYFFSHLKLKSRSGFFILALLLIIICTMSPLHWLAENYLFSAHMIAHIMLFLIVAPLLVLSIPPASSSKNYYVQKISQKLNKVPGLCWIAGVSMMWFWHIPIVFDTAAAMHGSTLSNFLHHAQSISLVVAGIIFCWPVIGPLSSGRLPALKGVIYLVTACISCSLLGLLITFAPPDIYTHYLTTPDMYGFAALIKNKWGITSVMDQQIAGLIMWVPGCLLYLTGSIYLIAKWFAEKEELPAMRKEIFLQ